MDGQHGTFSTMSITVGGTATMRGGSTTGLGLITDAWAVGMSITVSSITPMISIAGTRDAGTPSMAQACFAATRSAGSAIHADTVWEAALLPGIQARAAA